MQFNREICSDELCDEMFPLLKKHYVEIAAFQDIELKPDFETYKRMEAMGSLRIYTARAEDRTLIGYAVFFVNHNLHYSDSRQAVQDVIYIEQSMRGLGCGREFISSCDEALKNDGCQVVYQHVKNKHNFGPLLEKLNYQLVDLIYARRLDVQ